MGASGSLTGFNRVFEGYRHRHICYISLHYKTRLYCTILAYTLRCKTGFRVLGLGWRSFLQPLDGRVHQPLLNSLPDFGVEGTHLDESVFPRREHWCCVLRLRRTVATTTVPHNSLKRLPAMMSWISGIP